MSLLIKIPLDYEPKKKNRWLLRFPADLGIQEWWLQSCQRPHLKINDVEVPFLNTSTWVAGRYSWEPVNFTLNDPIGPSAAQAIMEWNRLCAESVSGRMGYASGYKRDAELELLDPTGVGVEKWILKNAWLTSSNFGDLDYKQDELAGITCDLRIDYAILVY
jgi:hypothetical protein